MKIRYTIFYFRGGVPVEGVLEYRPDKDYLNEIYEIALRKMPSLKNPPEVLSWRFEYVV